MGIRNDTWLTMTSDPRLLHCFLCLSPHLLLLELMHFNFEAKSFSCLFHLFSYLFILPMILFSHWGIVSDLLVLYCVLVIDVSPKPSFLLFPSWSRELLSNQENDEIMAFSDPSQQFTLFTYGNYWFRLLTISMFGLVGGMLWNIISAQCNTV